MATPANAECLDDAILNVQPAEGEFLELLKEDDDIDVNVYKVNMRGKTCVMKVVSDANHALQRFMHANAFVVQGYRHTHPMSRKWSLALFEEKPKPIVC